MKKDILKEPLTEEERIEAEKEELEVITGSGVLFRVPKSKLFARFSKEKERKFMIYGPPAGVMDLLSKEFIKLEINEQFIADDPLDESKKIVARTAMTAARIVAIAVLGEKSFIPFLSYITGARNLILIHFYTNYFAQKCNSLMLKQLAIIILKQQDYTNFTDFIRLLSTNRTTIPNLMKAA